MQVSSQSPESLHKFERFTPELQRTMADGTIQPGFTGPVLLEIGSGPGLAGSPYSLPSSDGEHRPGKEPAFATTVSDTVVANRTSAPEPNSLTMLGVGLCLSLLFFVSRVIGGRSSRGCTGMSRSG